MYREWKLIGITSVTSLYLINTSEVFLHIMNTKSKCKVTNLLENLSLSCPEKGGRRYIIYTTCNINLRGKVIKNITKQNEESTSRTSEVQSILSQDNALGHGD